MNGSYEIKLWKLNACIKRKLFYIFEDLSQPLAFFCVSKSINRGPVKKKKIVTSCPQVQVLQSLCLKRYIKKI